MIQKEILDEYIRTYKDRVIDYISVDPSLGSPLIFMGEFDPSKAYSEGSVVISKDTGALFLKYRDEFHEMNKIGYDMDNCIAVDNQWSAEELYAFYPGSN